MDLFRNELGPEGGVALAPSVAGLTKLNLSENRLGVEGGQAIAAALKSNSTLLKLEYVASCPPNYCQHPLTP